MCGLEKHSFFFHLHAVILPSAGFTPAIMKSRLARGVSLLTKHFQYTVAETAMSRPVGIFAALELFLHNYRSKKKKSSIRIWTPIRYYSLSLPTTRKPFDNWSNFLFLMFVKQKFEVLIMEVEPQKGNSEQFMSVCKVKTPQRLRKSNNVHNFLPQQKSWAPGY